VTTSLRITDALRTSQQRTTGMASNGKKKTTMAKMNRENLVRERRADKQAKKEARKQAAMHPDPVATGAPATVADPA
jgi:hypothetical protein